MTGQGGWLEMGTKQLCPKCEEKPLGFSKRGEDDSISILDRTL